MTTTLFLEITDGPGKDRFNQHLLTDGEIPLSFRVLVKNSPSHALVRKGGPLLMKLLDGFLIDQREVFNNRRWILGQITGEPENHKGFIAHLKEGLQLANFPTAVTMHYDFATRSGAARLDDRSMSLAPTQTLDKLMSE